MKKTVSSKLLIIIVVIFIAILAVTFLFFNLVVKKYQNISKEVDNKTSSISKLPIIQDENDTNTQMQSDEEIPYEIHKTNTSAIVINAVNNTSEIKNIKVEATFYKNKQMLSVTDENFHAVAPKQQIACKLIKPYDDNFKTVPFDDVKINITSELDKYYTSVIDKVELQHNKGAKDIIIKATNTSDKEINFLTCQVLFYKGKDIVACNDVTEMSVKPNATISLTAELPYDLNYENIKFDNYEVLITRATI